MKRIGSYISDGTCPFCRETDKDKAVLDLLPTPQMTHVGQACVFDTRPRSHSQLDLLPEFRMGGIRTLWEGEKTWQMHSIEWPTTCQRGKKERRSGRILCLAYLNVQCKECREFKEQGRRNQVQGTSGSTTCQSFQTSSRRSLWQGRFSSFTERFSPLGGTPMVPFQDHSLLG